MPPARRNCKFTKKLSQEFSFIESTKFGDEMTCTKCQSTFSITSGGRRDITRHLACEKHKKHINAAASSSVLTNYYRNDIYEVAKAINNLISKLEARLDQTFIPLIIRNDLTKLTEEGEINKEWFYSHVVQFYKNCFDYLRLWSSQFPDIGCLEWTDLNQCVEWENVQKTLEFISEHFTANDINESALFDEVTLIKNYATE
ncbi:hypothetical protein ILUMI_16951 [Ignelater luminosus]|uniref:Uncharacterized protein n=1 Tax=Ignelater luminosus TaxID=2038154 RepID=A0A8K0CRY0_IGNLU|nr:hypothetical protein ILUMI_16951 [Ignelater luminosus]